ncbi:MAG: hypothetical protein OXR82_00490 [Gammaproteobacteria bacterium]|nr:hypothetical protein [Gammaproteobacteria bacterium]MDE0256848.1 hypothetical protein [Gammaproteobacteria bacterium]
MFDLDQEVQRWREHQIRRSSLSLRELDELEDHLRIRVDLELELDQRLTPARAFAIARDELGETSVLSREFARAGALRWRRALVFGWALFALSFLLPALRFEFTRESVQVLSLTGYEVFWAAVTEGGFRHALCNLAMLLTLPALWRGRVRGGRWLAGGIGLMGLYLLETDLSLPRSSAGFSASLQGGYFVWAASFVCAAVGLWLRARDWVPTTAERPEA